MTTANFNARLNSALYVTGSEPFLKSFESLRQVATSLTLWLRGASLEHVSQVQVEPGFPSSLGQQFNFVIRIAAKGINDTLFRAYVNQSGEIMLDFFGDEPVVCRDNEDLENKVLGFLDRPEVKTRLAIYKEMSSN